MHQLVKLNLPSMECRQLLAVCFTIYLVILFVPYWKHSLLNFPIHDSMKRSWILSFWFKRPTGQLVSSIWTTTSLVESDKIEIINQWQSKFCKAMFLRIQANLSGTLYEILPARATCGVLGKYVHKSIFWSISFKNCSLKIRSLI